MFDRFTRWRQGLFVDQPQYNNRPVAWKDEMREDESYLVRPGPTDNAICRATTPELAVWIAERLNLANDLEILMRVFAEGDLAAGEVKEKWASLTTSGRLSRLKLK